jgi:hypothetical protein
MSKRKSFCVFVFYIVVVLVLSSTAKAAVMAKPGHVYEPQEARQSQLIVSEQFNDGDLTNNPTWTVVTGQWAVDDGELVINDPSANDRIEITWDDPAGFDANTQGMTIVASIKLWVPFGPEIYDLGAEPPIRPEAGTPSGWNYHNVLGFGLHDTDKEDVDTFNIQYNWDNDKTFYEALTSCSDPFRPGTAPEEEWNGFQTYVYDVSTGKMGVNEIRSTLDGTWGTRLHTDQWQTMTMTFDTRDGVRLFHDGVQVARWVNGKRLQKVNQLFFHLTNPGVHSSWADPSVQGQLEPRYKIDDVFVEMRTYTYASMFLGEYPGDESGFTPWTVGGQTEFLEEPEHERIIFGSNPTDENLHGWAELDFTQFPGFDPNAPMEIRFNIAEPWTSGSGEISVDLTLGNDTNSHTEVAVASAAVYGSNPDWSGYHSTDENGLVQFGGKAGSSIAQSYDSWTDDSFITLNFDQDSKSPKIKIYYEENGVNEYGEPNYDPSYHEPVQVAELETWGAYNYMDSVKYFRAECSGSTPTAWQLARVTLSDNTPTLLDRFTDGDYTNGQQWTVDEGTFDASSGAMEVTEPNSAIHLDFGGTYGVVNYSSTEVVFTARQNMTTGFSKVLKFGLYDTYSGQGYTESAALWSGYYGSSGFHSYDPNGVMIPGTADESMVSTFAHDEVFSIRFEAFGPTAGITVRKNKRIMAQWPNFLGLTSVDRFTIQKDDDDSITWTIDDVKVYAEIAGVPMYCGDAGRYMAGDISGPVSGVPDCRVDYYDVESMANSWLTPFDFVDFADLASQWLDCTYPVVCN